MRIQHNIMAMNAYRNYNINTSAVSKNLEKLSSGYKINRAGDDAAGLAISEKMRAQITGLEAAEKNVKDGISLVKTAEGAMQEVQDMLNRMVSLATQSANGTYDNEVDRNNLQKEVDQLRSEINRIADSANFNGIKLLDGSLDTGTNVVSLKDASDVATATAGTATGMTFTIVADGQMVDKEPTAGRYSVDFSQTKLVNTSSKAVTVTFALTANKSVTFSVAAGQEMNGEDLAAKIKEVLMGEHTPAVTTDDVDSDVGVTIITTSNSKFTFGVDGDKLIIQEVKPAAKQSDINGLVFSANFTGLATNANGNNVGATLVTGNNGNQFQVTPEVEPVSNASRAYGMATFSLTAAFVKDGAALKLGDTTYVFAVGKNSKYKDFDNVIDLTDIIPGGTTAGQLSLPQLNTAAQRLAKAATGNKQFIVGSTVGGTANNPIISLTEREGGIDYNVNNLAGKDGLASVNGAVTAGDATKTDWKGLIKIGTAQMSNSSKGTALTLQIGDTSDSFNQLKVSIGDIHTKALNIDGISIATQDAAAEAVNTIKDAINQVSSIRGTLGATQNRLEHTQNNLGVMKENIQDAESTIRDTDIAAEMMSYTKNNILVLAQANQIPQGVLQLLG